MEQIPVDRYLDDALRLTFEEAALRDRIMPLLPPTIIDCHAHCNLPEHVLELDEDIFFHVMSTFPSFTLERSYMANKIMYKDKTVHTVRFPNAYKGIEHRAANDYLMNFSPEVDRVALYGIPDDVGYTTTMLRSRRFVALKMYPAFATPRSEHIYQYFIPSILEECQHLELPIILHLPKLITQCLDDLQVLIADFPRLPMILAHLGLPQFVYRGLKEVYDEVARHDLVFMDTSFNLSAPVLQLALKSIGSSRILYGTDQPLNLIRAKLHYIPDRGQRLVAQHPYHWRLPHDYQEFGHLAQGAMHVHWQVLTNIVEAIDMFPTEDRYRMAEQIFHSNAYHLLGFG